MGNWLTADEHFGHKNIIRHCNRPFKDIQEQEKVIIHNVNKCLQYGDHLYHIGDFIWYDASRRQYYEKIMNTYRNGIIHHLILGNHDKAPAHFYVDTGFTSVHTSLLLEHNNEKLVLVHDPSAYCCIEKDTILVCGHIHTLFRILKDKKVVNVGVDVWRFRPINFDLVTDMFNGG